MNIMIRTIFLPLLMIPLWLNAQEPDSTSALSGMLEAERNFARESVTFGRNFAFISNLAEGSVIFTDKWITNGLQYWKEGFGARAFVQDFYEFSIANYKILDTILK